MEDICNFIPPNKRHGNIQYFHFVYETNVKKLRQPFLLPDFYAYLVFKGSAILTIGKNDYPLTPGTMFFTFPFKAHEIKEADNFSYFYISFNGTGASTLLENLNINEKNFIYYDFEHLHDFWMKSIRRITRTNAITLTESVLMYSLSFIDNSEKRDPASDTNTFDDILEYIDNNFTDPSLCLKKVADIFFYSEKYFSVLFLKKTGTKFTDHLNNLRIDYATKLIESNTTSISEIAAKCGYNDPLYFSKVFKKKLNETPSSFIRRKNS
ncbi:MAG: helix-turn-helix transcriptional regulator [Oscillospiraceae bacterium]|nr:helix-turn-helix transcriptional regulator [Oscillospiraceae bacterium]